MPFVHHVTTRFFQVDAAGILFFGRVFEMCHEAYEELLIELGHGIRRLFSEHDIGMPLVHAEADFHRPMRQDDRLLIELTVERVGGKSITFAYGIRGEDGELRAGARLVHAFVVRSRFEPCAPPRWLLDGLRERGLLPS